MTVLVSLALETVPDVAGYRAVHGLDPELSAGDLAEYMFQRQRAREGRDLLPPHWRRVAVACAVIRSPAGVQHLAVVDEDEAALLRRLVQSLPAQCDCLLAADGGAGLAALTPRALRWALDLPPLPVWLQGREAVLDLLAHCGVGSVDALDELAAMAGLPRVFSGAESDAWAAWQAGDPERLQMRCLARAVGAYRLYLRTRVLCGALAPVASLGEEAMLRAELAPHADLLMGPAASL